MIEEGSNKTKKKTIKQSQVKRLRQKQRKMADKTTGRQCYKLQQQQQQNNAAKQGAGLGQGEQRVNNKNAPQRRHC